MVEKVTEEEKKRFWGLQTQTIYVEDHPIIVVANREDMEWLFEFLDDISSGAPLEVTVDEKLKAYRLEYKGSLRRVCPVCDANMQGFADAGYGTTYTCRNKDCNLEITQLEPICKDKVTRESKIKRTD